jgi:hypothetical protein
MKQFQATRSVNSEKGAVLALALLALLVFSVLGLALLGIAMTETTMATNWRDYSDAFYAAEAGLEAGFVGLRNVLAQTLNPTDANLAGITAPTLSDGKLAFATFQVQRGRPAPPYSYQTAVASGPYLGLNAIATDYQITAEVTGPQGSKAGLTQIVQLGEIPLFQFGVFYGKGVDLEFTPGPPMTVTGRVHANSNIGVRDALSEAGFWFDSFMTTAGNICRCLKKDSNRYMNPQIKDANGVYRTLNFDHFSQDLDSNGSWVPWSVEQWKSKAMERFGGKVQDSAHGVQELIPPVPELFYNPSPTDAPVIAHRMIEEGKGSDTPAMKEAKLYYKADLIIKDGSAKRQDGSPVLLPPGVITTKTFWDDRERRNMTVTEVNISALLGSGQAPPNGILYVYKSGGGGGKGVRLVNGSQLPTGGLTVVSENPVYIQGDYNTVNKQPAAVLADAITVLSNNWGPNDSDKKGDKKKTLRPATNTTVNAAFALGPSHESVTGAGNGEMNNVIRFLEAWGMNDAKFTYRGSVVALWHSQQATGPFREPGSSNPYYGPPERDWGFDPLLATSQPPGARAFSAITITKARWSRN